MELQWGRNTGSPGWGTVKAWVVAWSAGEGWGPQGRWDKGSIVWRGNFRASGRKDHTRAVCSVRDRLAQPAVEIQTPMAIVVSKELNMRMKVAEDPGSSGFAVAASRAAGT